MLKMECFSCWVLGDSVINVFLFVNHKQPNFCTCMCICVSTAAITKCLQMFIHSLVLRVAHFKRRGMRFSSLIKILKLRQLWYTPLDHNLSSITSFMRLKGIHTARLYQLAQRMGGGFLCFVINYSPYSHYRCTVSVMEVPYMLENLTDTMFVFITSSGGT